MGTKISDLVSVGAADGTELFVVDQGGTLATKKATPTQVRDILGLGGPQGANVVYAGPPSGGATTPTWRALVAADLPVFVASGASHAPGAVPDPGSTGGTTRFLREDATWAIPAGGGGGSSFTTLTEDATNKTLNRTSKMTWGTAVTAFGDSIMLGNGASTTPQKMAEIIRTARGWTLTQDSISGSQLVGQINAATTGIYSIASATNANYMMLTGFNDMRWIGSSSTGQLGYQQALYAALTWLAIPDSKKIKGQSGSIAYGGSGWTNSTLYGGALGKKSSTNGDTATVSLRGSTILLGIGHKNAGSGTFSVTIDGVAASGSPFSCGGNWNNNALTTGPEVIVLKGLTNTLHTVVLTVGGADVCELDWCVGLGQDIVTWDAPRVYVGNCLRMNATGYTLGGSFSNGSEAAVIAFNSIISTVIADLQSIGLQVVPVNASSVYNPDDADVNADNIHPNNSGHARIANEFIRATEASGSSSGGGSSATIVGTSNQITAVTSGGITTLSTPQDIATSSTPTFKGATLTGGTVTTSSPVLSITQTWNAGGVAFTGILANITNTASAAGSKLIDLQVGGLSKFNVDPNGTAAARAFLVSVGVVGTSSLSLDGATQTASTPVITATQTWNNGAITFAGILLNVTDTASASTSKLIDVQVSGASKFNADKNGLATAISLQATGLAGVSALTLTGGTQTTNVPTINTTVTWNNGAITFDAAWFLNVTDTASGATSKLLDLQVAAASKFNVNKAGLCTSITFASTATTDATTISTGSMVCSGGLGVAKYLCLDGATGKTLRYVNVTANGSVATTLGSVGPTGATAGDPQGWMRFSANGTDRFIPFW